MKRCPLGQAYRLKDHARRMAAREGRPYEYFGERTRKEDLARQMVERNGIQEGLVCVCYDTVKVWRGQGRLHARRCNDKGEWLYAPPSGQPRVGALRPTPAFALVSGDPVESPAGGAV